MISAEYDLLCDIILEPEIKNLLKDKNMNLIEKGKAVFYSNPIASCIYVGHTCMYASIKSSTPAPIWLKSLLSIRHQSPVSLPH
jgi:hypothetical protein